MTFTDKTYRPQIVPAQERHKRSWAKEVQTLDELKEAFNDPGVRVAYIQGPAFSQKEIKYFKILASLYEFDGVGVENNTNEDFIDGKVARELECYWTQMRKKAPRDPKYLDAILNKLHKIEKAFPSHKISAISFRQYYYADAESANWHQDSAVESHLRFIVGCCGPSTEYAKDQNGKEKTTLKRESISVHRLNSKDQSNGAWHRQPQFKDDRLALVVELEKI